MQIASRLEQYGAVLVQGPPGTGKTHTIANLIGHLLAQGKTVLVTAHTSKALRVLREQIVEPLRPLCVSVLDDDLESRRQLEEAVNAIVLRLNEGDARVLEKEAQRLENRRSQLIREVKGLREELRDAVESEYRSIVVAGREYDPSSAARLVAEGYGRDDWIPGQVKRGVPLPLSRVELDELYQLNGVIQPDDEVELSQDIPDPSDLITPERFKSLVEILDRAIEGHRPDLWIETDEASRSDPDYLESLGSKAEEIGGQLLDAEQWELAVVEAGKDDGQRQPWEQLVKLAEEIRRDEAASADLFIRHQPVLAADWAAEEQEQLASQLAEEAERRGGRISRFVLFLKPRWRRFVEATEVAAGKPQTVEHFLALAAKARLQKARDQLRARWDFLFKRWGGRTGSELGDVPERVVLQYAPLIRRWLRFWSESVLPLIRELSDNHLNWTLVNQLRRPDLTPLGEYKRLGQILSMDVPLLTAARAMSIRQARARAELSKLMSMIWSEPVQSRVVGRIRQAIVQRNVNDYRDAYERLCMLQKRREDLRRREQLLARLEQDAPEWAAAIRNRIGVHGSNALPGDPEAAWLWRQLNNEVIHRASVSIQNLQEQLAARSEELRRITAALIEKRAWAAQLRRTSLEQRQALIGWLNTMRRLGRGTGRRAPELRARAAELLTKARESVPVWIMPMARVVEQFDPRTTRFDVVIIDEASQSDALALTALYLARQAVVVGDHEQVSPLGVGQLVDRIRALQDEYLRDIPNGHLYDGMRSIYDIARESFGGALMLVEHFRSVPEIIQFSNFLSYEGRIRPLRDSSSVLLKPHVVPYRVHRAYVENKQNWEEAVAIVSLLLAAVRHPAYKGKSFGVISLVGDEQVRLIENLLGDYLPVHERIERRILCGTPPQFQGDERDVIFISVVDAPDPDGRRLPMRQDDRWKQRINVAASRARDQMWVVYSLDPKADLQEGDLRRRLIEYALDPDSVVRVLTQESARTESPFEREVLRRLVAAGYRVHTQWQAGYYRIDLVVEGGGRRVAIECDGDRYHPPEKLMDDLERQAVLERLGWQFVRIRGTEFYRNPDLTMDRVFAQLERLGIRPEGYVQEQATPAERECIANEVIRMAEELRRSIVGERLSSVAD